MMTKYLDPTVLGNEDKKEDECEHYHSRAVHVWGGEGEYVVGQSGTYRPQKSISW